MRNLYRMLHIPSGFYYKPVGSNYTNLCKNGKIYHTVTNGVKIQEGKFYIYCSKSTRVYKKTVGKLDWQQCSYNTNIVKLETKAEDWIKEGL